MGDKGGGSSVGKQTEAMAREYYDETQPLRDSLIGNYMNFLGVPSGGAAPAGASGPAPALADLESQLAAARIGSRGLSPKRIENQGDPYAAEIRSLQNKIANWQPTVADPDAEGNNLQSAYDVTRNPVFRTGRQVIENQYDIGRQNMLGQVPEGGALIDTLANMETGRAQSIGGLSAEVAQDEYNKLFGLATGAPGQAMSTMSGLAGQQAMANAQQQAGKYGALGDLGLGAGMLLV